MANILKQRASVWDGNMRNKNCGTATQLRGASHVTPAVVGIIPKVQIKTDSLAKAWGSHGDSVRRRFQKVIIIKRVWLSVVSGTDKAMTNG